MKTRNYIKQNEGLRLKPYRCTAGKLSIGYGRNLDDRGISAEEAELLLGNDIHIAIMECYKVFTFPFFEKLSQDRQTVLIDMMFCLGYSRFTTFKKMIQAVENEDFARAADEILNSNYAKQVPERAQRNAELMGPHDT